MRTKKPALYGEVRFHLSKGEHFMHWQVKVFKNGKRVGILYYDPAKYQLEMGKCVLVNYPTKAKQVFEAGVHDVSGWVQCEELKIRDKHFPRLPIDTLEKLYYNPIRDPHWRRESDCNEFIWDDTEYATLLTDSKQVYILEERV